jgi:mannose-6-phosphate isomerase
VILSPARLQPVFSTRPWGSRSLAPHFPEKTGLAEPIGEAWLTGNDSRFANGPFAGRALGEAWRQMPAEWTGTAFNAKCDFPLLVKFLFTEDKLSVQVHPDDEHATRHEIDAGGRGKTEMWYALRARAGAEVMVGLKPEVTREDFQRCIDNGTAEDCLTRVPVRAGDAIFVPAGAAHTIGPGLLLCEIQQHSDITYRVYDYNRPDSSGKLRDLHIEKALHVMRFGPQKGGKIEPLRLTHGAITEAYLAACPYFVTEKWKFSEPFARKTDSAHFDLLIFLEGHGDFRWDHVNELRAAYRPTEVWLLPASLGDYRLAPASLTALLRTYVPRDLKEFVAQLAKRGVAESEISRLIHS